MGYTMINLLFVWIRLVISFTYTFSHNFGITFLVTSIFAIGTLHSCGIFQKIATKSTTHNVVELLRNKFVPLFLVHLFFLLTNSSLSVETDIKGSTVLQLFCYTTVRSTNAKSQGEDIPKLIVRCILPTGSKANHESTMTAALEELAPDCCCPG